MARFTLRKMTGYDGGHLTPRFISIVGSFESLSDARAAAAAHNAQFYATNSQASFCYVDVLDRDHEHAVVGFGRYGNGGRITAVMPILSVASGDDVLFRGSRQQCEAFAA